MNFELPPPIPTEPRAPRPKGSNTPQGTASTDLPQRGLAVPPPLPPASSAPETSPQQSSTPKLSTDPSTPPSKSGNQVAIGVAIAVAIVIFIIVLASQAQRSTYPARSDTAQAKSFATPSEETSRNKTLASATISSLTKDEKLLAEATPTPTPLPSPSPTPLPAGFSEAAKAFPGLWTSPRHDYLFKADGTWVMDPETGIVNGTSGTWWIKGDLFHWTTNEPNTPPDQPHRIIKLTKSEIAFTEGTNIYRMAKTAELSSTTAPTPAPQTYRVIGVSSGDYLNVRQGPGANYPVVTRLLPTATGIALEQGRTTNGSTVWQQISTSGYSGWVNADYIVFDPPSNGTSDQRYQTLSWLGRTYSVSFSKAQSIGAAIEEFSANQRAINSAISLITANQKALKNAGWSQKATYTRNINELIEAKSSLEAKNRTLASRIDAQLNQ